MGSGPAPDPNALRRNRKEDQAGWTTLPASGRDGRAPGWPLLPDIGLRAKRSVIAAKVEALEWKLTEATSGRGYIEEQLDRARERLAVVEFQIAEQDSRERLLWTDLWKLPQAVAWERDRATRDVAQFVRHKILGELGSLDDAKEARQWSDRLGLNPTAMLRLRWKVSADQVGERRSERAERVTVPRGTSARDRLKALDGGGA